MNESTESKATDLFTSKLKVGWLFIFMAYQPL